MNIGARIREYRKAMGWKSKKLAEAMGVTKTTVCHWEHNRKEPTLANAIALADTFGVSLDNLVGRHYGNAEF